MNFLGILNRRWRRRRSKRKAIEKQPPVPTATHNSALGSLNRAKGISQYKHLPTNGRHIRLFHLLCGEPSDQICGDLSVVDLDAPHQPYIAVSYTWGPADEVESILVNGWPMSIRRNLHQILQAFRSPSESVVLWVDALSIDQHALEERNHQVGMMGDIFSRATRVNAWLGFTNVTAPPSTADKETITAIQQAKRWRIPRSDNDRFYSNIVDFQSRKYWSRAWITQELVLAKDIMFFCEGSAISWQDLLSVISRFDKRMVTTIRTIAVMKNLGYSGDRSFEELFARFGHLQCMIDHDKFYCLYGMVQGPSQINGSLPSPNYGLCLTEVFLQFMSRWEDDTPVWKRLNFAMDFTRNFPQLSGEAASPCRCHTRSVIRFQQPLYRIVHDTKRERNYGDDEVVRTVCLCAEHQDKGHYQRLKIADDLDIRDGDPSFEIAKDSIRSLKLVVTRDFNHLRHERSKSTSFTRIGLITDRSLCQELPSELSDFSRGNILHLNNEANVLAFQINVEQLMGLARYLVKALAATSKIMIER